MALMLRWVLHIDMDAFFASVEQLTRPTLRGRPVVVGGLGGRGVVAGCSYEAREYGIHSAMPMVRARRLMPGSGVVVYPRKGIYGPVSRRVFDVVREKVDIVEQLSVDEAFMEPPELAGAEPDEVRRWAEELRAQILQETGLPSSIGAGSGKQFAKIGSGMAKPDGVTVIGAGQHEELLHPLPVGKLWGIGPVSEGKLRGLGVTTIGSFASMSLRDVEVSLGKTVGPALWRLAQGHDDRPVKKRAVAKSISAEHTYPEDLVSRGQVDAAIDRAGKSAFRRLLKDGRGARTVTVKVRLADLSVHTRSETLSFATTDQEVLLAVARRISFNVDSIGAMRLVGVGFSGLDTTIQEVMFPELDVEQVVADDLKAVTDVLPVFRASDSSWTPTTDVHHEEFGHGWVQGAGHGVVSVRFESRLSGPGRMKTLREDDPALKECSPLCSLDWDEWFRTIEDEGIDAEPDLPS